MAVRFPQAVDNHSRQLLSPDRWGVRGAHHERITCESVEPDSPSEIRVLSVVGDDPILMLTAPIPATRRVLNSAGVTLDDIDVYEVNEAFASVPLAWAAELGAAPAKLNPRGGAIALGHAMGSSGTRLLATMVNHLEATNGRYGLQTMCEGGGMANAMIIERL